MLTAVDTTTTTQHKNMNQTRMSRLSYKFALAATLLSQSTATGNSMFSTAPDDLEMKSTTRLTKPLPLAVGEVSNTFHTLDIPPGPIAVYEFKADIVEIDPDTNEIIPVPLNEAYLHHHVVGSNHKSYEHMKDSHSPMKPEGMFKGVGFGAGTESRGTPQKFYYPFAFTTEPDEDTWIANVHVINTREMTTSQAGHCLECPCTSEDVLDGLTVNYTPRGWTGCNDFVLQVLNNDACHAETYKGGLRCCEHGEYCLERSALPENGPISTFYLRYTITYSELRPENRALRLAACCDATGDLDRHGNIEYDVPQCDDPVNNPEECIYELTTVQMLHSVGNNGAFGVLPGDKEGGGTSVDVVYTVGHMHRGGIEIEIADEETGEVICLSKPTYGKDQDVVGKEKDYIVSMSTCTFNPPRKMRTSDLVRVTARYDSTKPHTGVMSLFYIAAADPVDDMAVGLNVLGAALTTEAGVIEETSTSESLKIAFVSIGLIAICVLAVKKFGRKDGYSRIEAVNVTV
mmetsp:Transcript_24785/g.36044  ORF Transcript_24785/g.36044 Transcript_24785/m.36044 type:complete len:516 (+) Transcript_24785:13-1560(+)